MKRCAKHSIWTRFIRLHLARKLGLSGLALALAILPAAAQKIAEMGNTDADQVKLHFEIRRLGKPMDPVRYLPPA